MARNPKVEDERGSIFCENITSNHVKLYKQNIEVSTNVVVKDNSLKLIIDMIGLKR